MNKLTKKTLRLNKTVIYKNKSIIVANFIVWLAINCFPLIIAVIIKNIFDYLELKNDYGHTILSCALIGFVVLQSICIIFGGKVDTITRFDIRKLIRKNIIYNTLKKRDSKNDTGQLIEIITSDISSFEELVSVEIDLICKLIFAVVSFFILLTISVQLTILVLVPIIIISNCIFKLGEKIKEKHKDARDSSINYSSFINDIINGRETVQFVSEIKYVLNQMYKLSQKRKKQTIKQDIFNKMIGELVDFSGILSIMIILIAASFGISNGQISIGELTLAISLTGYISEYNGLFNEVFRAIKYSDNTIIRVKDILGCENEDDSVNAMLYDGILNDEPQYEKMNERLYVNIDIGKGQIKFDISSNEIVAVCGKTGSGKTHLLDSLIGYSQYDGIIKYGNSKIDYLKNVGISLQEPKFLDESIEENILFSKDASIEGALQMVHLFDELKNIITINSNIGVNGRKLSDGQRQRLSIIRAIMNGDHFLILDDSTSLLDYDNELLIMKMLKSKKYTVLIVSNRKNVLKEADKIIFMEDEKVNSIGTYYDLIDSCELFRKVYYE